MNANLEIRKTSIIEPIWCATANVIKERPFGEEHIIKKGTKHFRGAKVHIASAYGGMCENATVIGHHRSNGRYIKIDMPVKHLENFRLELVYSPKVIELIDKNSQESFVDYTKEYAEKLIILLPEWIEMYHRG